MKVTFDQKFMKRLDKIDDKDIINKVKKVILSLERAATLNDVQHLKKLESRGHFYRIRLGDYRIGFELLDETVCLITIAHRKDVYKYFP